MKKIFKNALIFVLILAAAVVGYLFLRKTPEAPLQTVAPTTTTPALAPTTAIGQEFLNMLLSLKNLKIDSSVFKDKVFLNLRDFSTPITRDPGQEGRPNPFLPFTSETGGALVETIEATPVTGSEATLNGLVDLSLAAAAKRFKWGQTEDLENQTDLITETASTGFFSKTLVDLVPGTTYFFRAEVVSGGQVVPGETLSFTTLEE